MTKKCVYIFFIRFSLCQFPTFKCQILSQFHCQKFLIRVSNFDSILKQIDCFFNRRSIYVILPPVVLFLRFFPVIACGSESARDLEKRRKFFVCYCLFLLFTKIVRSGLLVCFVRSDLF